MAWFNFLKAEGYFSPIKNPEPIPVKEGFQIPYWEILGYLEKLSIEIKKGNELHLIDEVLAIIKNVSEHPKDNYRTWYIFIKILSNLPNESVTKEIIGFLPVWFSGQFDTMLQTSEVCETLLPKFLNDAPTKEDVEKAESILEFLFRVERTETYPDDFWDGEGNSYNSRLYLHFLANAFLNRDLISKIVKSCSNEFILKLGRTIKMLLLNYPKGVNSVIKDNEKKYDIKIYIDKNNLIVVSKPQEEELVFSSSAIYDFEELSEDGVRNEFIATLKQQGIDYTPKNGDFDDTFERLKYVLNADLPSPLGTNAISELGDRYNRDEKAVNVFSLIFRELLDEKAKQKPDEAVALLLTICFDNKYRTPFYRRVALYIIGENWDNTKEVFWKLVKENDALQLFSKYKYHDDLYELLSKNQHKFTITEKKVLEHIINQGDQKEVDDKDERHAEYWKLRWYSALKETEPFKEEYLKLSKLLNITSEHYENLGKVRISSGSITPISLDELLEKSNNDIAELLHSFKTQNQWDGPNISGLADTFKSAVESEPQKFANEIECYRNIPFIYAYNMLSAFDEAWGKEKVFDWANVLYYCLEYIKGDKFYSEQLQLQNDGWGAKYEWVVGSIARLLTHGMQNEKQAFEIDLLPIAKEIIQILVVHLEPIDDFDKTNMDYPTYSLNSIAGKVLRALLDYSLRRARSESNREGEERWEPEMKTLFTETLQKGIIDGYILEGLYFRQFYFLDREWIEGQVKQHHDIEKKYWLAFMGGVAFSNPPFNKDLYELFYTHYDKAIEDKIELKSFYNAGLVKHLTAFYFWGYEDLQSEKLLLRFLNTAEPKAIESLLSFIWQQEEYPKSLVEHERKHFENIIVELWSYLVNKYDNSHDEEEQKILASSCRLIVFVPELNESYTNLLLRACSYIDKNYYTRGLLEELATLKNKGNHLISAKSIGDIISILPFNDYFGDEEQKWLIELVTFLFLNDQKQTAINFCNRMAIKHQLFLRETYEKYAFQKG